MPQKGQNLKNTVIYRFLVIPPSTIPYIQQVMHTLHFFFFFLLVVCIWGAEFSSESVSLFCSWDIRLWTCLCTADAAWGRWYLEMHCRTFCVTLHTELCMPLQCYILCAHLSRKSLSLWKLGGFCRLCPFRDFYSTVPTRIQIRCMCNMQYQLDCDGFNS